MYEMNLREEMRVITCLSKGWNALFSYKFIIFQI